MNGVHWGWLVAITGVLLVVVYVSCGGATKKTGHGTDGDEYAEDKDIPDGLDIDLSEADDYDPKKAKTKQADATVLSAANTKALLARLPDIKEAQTSDFAFRKRSPPAPRPGKTISDKFPAKGDAAPPTTNVSKGPLQITRYAPEGELGLAPHVSITFSDAMVALSSHDDVQAKKVPLKLSPTPEGRWRWLGTRTLIFDPVIRMPMATKFSLEVPAGTTSANGNKLAEAHRWTFTTPPPSVVSHNLSGRSRKLTPLLFVGFDQKINADDVLGHLRVEVDGDRVAVRKLNGDELEDDAVHALIEASDKRGPNRYVAFTVTSPLPKATDVYVGFPEGLPSAEGPLRTTSEQSFSFRTFDPLRIEDQNCDRHECYPGSGLSVRFNNQLDQDAFDPATIKVRPELKNMRAVVNGSNVVVSGLTRAETTYHLTIPASLKDQFGQTFGEDDTLDFRFGEAHPRYFAPNGLVVADPGEKKPKFRVHTFGHDKLHVEAYRMTPEDWTRFQDFQRNPIDWNRRRHERPSFKQTPFKAFNPRPGKHIYQRTINIKERAKGELTETAIELEEVLGGRYGHAFLLIVGEPHDADPQNVPPYTVVWIQSTILGVEAVIDDEELLVWTNNLEDGSEKTGVSIDAFFEQRKFASTKTQKRGLATIRGSHQPTRAHIVARSGDQSTILPGTNFLSQRGASMAWHVFDDRRMYKPGEEVHVKGWVRQIQWSKGGDVTASPQRKYGYLVYGTRGNELHKGKLTLNAFGGFDMKFKLPDNANLGTAQIVFGHNAIPKQRWGNAYTHSFQIQEFRRPEYEVSVEKEEGPFVVGTSTEVTATASYFAGGGLPQTDVQWQISQTPASYAPPGWEGFTFGKWVPWWIHRGWWGGPPTPNRPALSFSSTTDGAGKHRLAMAFKSVKPAEPTTVRAQATIQDVNRQAWAAETSLLVHPSSYYVGLKVEKPYAEKGEPVHVDAVLANIEGEAVAQGTIAITFARIETQWENGEYTEVEREAQTCEISSKAGDKNTAAVRCSFEPEEGGRHRVRAHVRDKEGRLNKSELTVWVSGVGQPKGKRLEEERVDLVPDKEEYKPGETAEIFVQSPFAKAEGLVTTERSGILTKERISIEDGSTVIRVPIKDAHTPNLFVRVDLVGEMQRLGPDGKPLKGAGKRPAFATGSIGINVPPHHRELKVEVLPSAKRVAPATVANVKVKVSDAKGRPKPNAEVAIVIVDEAILALTGAEFVNPLSAFYPQRPNGVSSQRLRRFVQLTDPEALEEQNRPQTTTGAVPGGFGEGAIAEDEMMEAEAAPMEERSMAADSTAAPSPAAPRMAKRAMAANTRGGETGSAAKPQPKVAVRTDFRALVAFAPEERTNAKGFANLKIKLPDSLTRYRVIAMAVEGDKLYGKGESNITARKPLMVRPSAPRFLNFGDKFELPIVVQNQTNKNMTVSLASRASNITFTKGQGRRFSVPANDRVEVRLPGTTEMAGEANFQVIATAASYDDAAFFQLPVWTPATTEAFAEYGTITEGAVAQPIAAPSKVVPQFGGLEITTTSTQLHTLTDAVLYLVSYPYECAEQISSRMLGVAALEKVLGEFKAEGLPPADEIRKTVSADIERLQGLQNYDGGFSFWRRGLKSWPWVTVHVAHALQRAKEAGFDVPSGMMQQANTYLRNVDSHMRRLDYGPRIRRTIESYALYVRARGGDTDAARAAALVDNMEDEELEARAWALFVMGKAKSHASVRKEVLRHFSNRATETASTAQFTTNFGEGAYTILHSSRRTDAVILESLLDETPKDKLAVKLMRGLLAHKTKGRWRNTQENVFVLLALKKYFEVFEKVTPNFVARAWLGDQLAAEHAFRGRTTERHHVDIPMPYVLKSPTQNLIVSKDGPGRLYYRLGMTYAPKSLWLAPRDEGFAVERTYEAVDDEGDVTRQDDGTWVVKAGARVRVRLTMVAESRRYHVALVDPLPAGFESMNPSLAVTGDIPEDPKADPSGAGGRYWWWWRPWYEHQNMRDERTEAFASLLYPGVYEYSYVARATTPGTFIVPPTKAEEMYAPETFGRAASEKVIVR